MRKNNGFSEARITEAIAKNFYQNFLESIRNDVIVVGAGPSGLMAAKELAESGFEVLIIESNNYLGGGFWIGGYLMNTVTFRKHAKQILDELDIPYKSESDDLYSASGPHACSKLIAKTCDSGVKILNMTKFDDLILKNEKVEGVVINWSAVSSLPRALTCVDPVGIESKLVIDATGHDAEVVNSLAKRGILNIKGYSGMWADESEKLVVEKTEEVYPGLIVTGMATATVFGLPRMGPIFGSMLLSGRKAAQIAKQMLSNRIKPEFNKITQKL
jgi:sulfide-dependent adenosine diphosphate thiazole synthase